MQGQIPQDSLFGKWLFDISRRDDVHTIVEIGTWNGAGSTRCIYEAIKGTDKQFYSLEVSKEMYDIATGQYPKDQNIHLILGKITDNHLCLDNYSSEYFSDYSREVKRGWLNQDLKNMASVPNVLDLLPQKIDFLLLDGSEFSSWDEYLILKDRSRIIAADDTRTPCFKNVRVREELIKERKVLVDEQGVRNGFIISSYV